MNNKEITDINTINNIPQYIYMATSKGEEVATINPEWKKLQILKYFNFYLKISGIPQNYWSYDLDNIHIESSIIDQAREFIRDVDKTTSLYLYGENSTGKTTTACVIAKELIKLNLNCYYILSSDAIDCLMASSGYNNSVEDEVSSLRNKLKDIDILIVDDIFDKNKSLYWNTQANNLIVGQWDYLIRYRCSHKKKNIFTSNVDINKINTDFGRSISELIETNFKFIKFERNDVKNIRQSSLL